MKLTLVSFSACPYVQRAAIMLREKRVDYEARYVDLANKPDWFLKISPRGKVPVLVVDDVPIFESQAICEYLDETCDAPRLMPDDPLLRARDRGWFQFAEDVYLPVYRLMYAPEREVYEQSVEALLQGYTRLDQELAGRDYLSGDGERFGMADVALAPNFTKLDLIERLGGWRLPDDLKNVARWRNAIMSRSSIQGSVPDDYEQVSRAGMQKRGAYLLSLRSSASSSG